ncbi:uncharacterized protein LOC109608673 isoform X2 [Aethina tumida]|uniref:uncharacterized protein LOC109608673 isoform X2 n=1 Tax=Aethina tumida TaxID=116153 RepID=UPI0021488EB4|nr:uncharacterized protein LOC109608673 isoform X2 [Aethina tumida]
MDKNYVQLVGGPCGQHGPYTFYKAFKYTKNGVGRIVTLSEFFFVKLWIDSDLLCIGELQLLWIDKNSEQVLASLRLYFLPENTPEGRMDHGEDEVLAISEKVVIRVEDLITWITVDAEWTWGRLAKCQEDIKAPIIEESVNTPVPVPLTESSLDFSDVEKERKLLEPHPEQNGPSVLILSYPKYCRYRAMMKRLENVENDHLKLKIINALGGFAVVSRNTRILFCRDTFDYPELEGHELLCNHLAPKLKGRPRGKRKKRSVSPGSESNESESSVSNSNTKQKITTEGGRNGLRCDETTSPRRSTRSADVGESKQFLKKLNTFMKANHTPIGRIPSLGYKELDLYGFFSKVQKLGGYDSVTTNRLWKSIFDDMSGHQNSTSAATVIRRHYERFLLPYERHIKGEEHKPLPVSERRRLKSKTGSSVSDNENSEGPSTSGLNNYLDQPSCSGVASTSKEYIIDNAQNKSECKTSSTLRSVRVKPERQKDKLTDKMQNNNNSNNNFNETEMMHVKDDEKPKLDKLVIKTESGIIKTESGIIKTDPNVLKVELKSESTIRMELIKVEKMETIDKDAEPLTSAVAPIVQKISPEKSLSPIEGKENVPFIKTGDTGSKSASEADVVEVPFKPKTPEIVDLESETFKTMNSSINKTYIQEVKKRKLDILKEGGLEVTPVRSGSSTSTTKDPRPSVIHPTVTTIPILHNQKKDPMPPPSINIVPCKRLHITIPQTVSQSKQTNQKSPIIKNSSPTKAFPFTNGAPPPKVLQSKSIYSFSGTTVYGNPKDVLDYRQTSPQAYAPRVAGNYTRHTGGDILDLTTSSPQKPVVDVMRVPHSQKIHSLSSRLAEGSKQAQKCSTPLIDGRRLGSNLEITLVGPNSKPQIPNSPAKYNMNAPPPVSITPQASSRLQQTQKRLSNELMFNNKMLKTDDNKFTKPSSHQLMREPKPNLQISMANAYANKSPSISAEHLVSNLPKSVAPSKPPPEYSYLPHFYDQSKYIFPHSVLDYYAMQGLYNSTPLAAPQMLLPNPEQLKLYAEFINSQSRLSYPFNLPQDANQVNNNFKKP